MSVAVHLNVLLPSNRDKPGWLRVEVRGIPMEEFRVLGRGSATVGGKPTGNPTRNPLLHAGNTPVGQYVGTELVDTSRWNQPSYGPWGAVRLRAIGGQALVAERLGRTGLLIHGGSEGRFDGFKSTKGCLRVTDDDMKRLKDILFSAGNDAGSLGCSEVTVSVTVDEI